MLIGNDNYWKGHGIQCMLVPAINSTVMTDDNGSGFLISGGGETTELDHGNCLISYTLIETMHAAIYMLIAVSCAYCIRQQVMGTTI